ncbi:MAG: 1-acyl-sn-glycerol-3-phosphate acyltransferase [Parcubacteria group bacterium GW2011_GWA2_43_13]|nr:MAG: 1-acyl-sn-glycerol-3-phosphate acyltransferase [Parcubacteria group bacterium GW2011_GWA2_43_13]
MFPLLQNIARYLYRVEVCGWENLPKTAPVVFVSNHASHFDTPLLVSLLTQWAKLQGVELYVVGARDYWGIKGRIRAFMCECFHVLLIERSNARGYQLGKDLTLINTVLHQGHALIMYPEGGRQSDPLRGMPFKDGVSVIVRKAELVPLQVVPIFIFGTHLVWSKKSRLFSLSMLFRARIQVRLGQAIDSHLYGTQEALTKALEQAVDALRQEYQRRA